VAALNLLPNPSGELMRGLRRSLDASRSPGQKRAVRPEWSIGVFAPAHQLSRAIVEVRSGCHECSFIPVDQFRDPALDAVKLANERIKKLAA